MTRTEFLNIRFTNLPYFNFSRTNSTKYFESFHVKNSNTKKQLNFLYRCDDVISVGMVDLNEKNEYKKHTSILECDKNFSEEKANNFIKKYLSET